MERGEKARMRDYIGQHLDVSSTRLSDYQAQRLVEFIDSYDQYRGKSFTKRRTHRDFSSDGRYERHVTIVDTFTEAVGIYREYSYRDDDGQEGGHREDIRTARGILDWLDANG
ncbi:hypothetical protein LTA6_002628 [Microbacterium sp. LTA6]|uniref:hypothetical protein n=1 Tax=Microbacterium sp. LTA6 TaxID=3129771 RepID=UPI00324B00A2